VIIHLGTNDHSTEPHPDAKDFTQEYVKFLKHIREKYPKALIYCFVTSGWPNFAPVIDKIVEKRNSAGDKHVYMVNYDPIAQNEMGCDWHPNYLAHQKLADKLVPVLKEAFDW
jgi:lysophospholipase L1-like esterase